MDALGDRMKAYEDEFNIKIEPYYPFIIRLDGKNFSKFTNGFKKPFDPEFVKAMVLTMNDLVEKFNPNTGYCHSDEITLVFPPACTKEEFDAKENKSIHPHDGRVIKFCTVLSGYCSARFNNHISSLIREKPSEYPKTFLEKVESNECCFDARPLKFPFDKPGEVVNHMIWRSVYDCHRNAVSTYARYMLGHKKATGLNSAQMIDEMKKLKLDWENDVPMHLKHGVYAKKELYEKIVEIKGQEIKATRQRITNRTFKIEYSENMVELMFSKYWSDDKPGLEFSI